MTTYLFVMSMFVLLMVVVRFVERVAMYVYDRQQDRRVQRRWDAALGELFDQEAAR